MNINGLHVQNSGFSDKISSSGDVKLPSMKLTMDEVQESINQSIEKNAGKPTQNPITKLPESLNLSKETLAVSQKAMGAVAAQTLLKALSKFNP